MARWAVFAALWCSGTNTARAHEASFSTAALRPPLGWSTWTTFKCAINETLVYEAIDALQNSGLAKSGYEYVLCDCKPCHCPTSLRLYLSKWLVLQYSSVLSKQFLWTPCASADWLAGWL